MIDKAQLKFDENGLIPAIVSDAGTGEVLMLAYMNAESLQISIDEGKTCFWSRSRGELWRKGSTSGNVQHIVSIQADCDMDTLLVKVSRDGPACHTGSDSCFINDVYEGTGQCAPFSLKNLHGVIKDRKVNTKPGSYTNYLFDKGIDKILKKFGEEAIEVVIAGKAGDESETVYELADLTYHAYVLMTQLGIEPKQVLDELASRYTVREES